MSKGVFDTLYDVEQRFLDDWISVSWGGQNLYTARCNVCRETIGSSFRSTNPSGARPFRSEVSKKCIDHLEKVHGIR